jgi:integrase
MRTTLIVFLPPGLDDLLRFEQVREPVRVQFRKEFVDQIDKAHLMRFMDYLVDDDPDNCPFTAAWKLMRVNKWIRTVLHLDPGKGPIKKSDLRRELESNAVAEIYTQEELKALFAVMDEDEFLRYETFLKSGLRKKELMFLEEDDGIIDLRPDGKEKREIRVERKNHYDFIPKNGKSRNVPIPRDLAERLSVWKEKKRASKLLFSTKTGSPDRHMLEKLRSIAKCAGLDVWFAKSKSSAGPLTFQRFRRNNLATCSPSCSACFD